MSQLSSILRDTTDNGLRFWCPGCDEAHRIQHGAGSGPRWGWNGNIDKPTFTPSILVTSHNWSGDVKTDSVCHSFVTDGRIAFLGDCTHSKANQTVDIPPWPKPPQEWV